MDTLQRCREQYLKAAGVLLCLVVDLTFKEICCYLTKKGTQMKFVFMKFAMNHNTCTVLQIRRGGSRGVFGVSRPPLQKYIREAKKMIYWYKNTLKCIIS